MNNLEKLKQKYEKIKSNMTLDVNVYNVLDVTDPYIKELENQNREMLDFLKLICNGSEIWNLADLDKLIEKITGKSLDEALKNKNYKHKEAFCLMEYQCENCKRIEILWNSRDGVTPFNVPCLYCNGMMQHVNWHNDKWQENFKPSSTTRVFVDMTKEKYKQYKIRMIEENWEKESCNFKMKDCYENKEIALEEFMKEFNPRFCDIITGKEYLEKEILNETQK